ncbi:MULTISPECIES: hypothetical protein [unclassified Mesorhizobium]|uniref:hypothetical protein n=1 Tax=unclassified Mesorhizobium TaxID=325217 RepID=UPI00112E5B2E|nr:MULTISPECIES: hypothetical protein [unclassified Mesorhizobium]TPN46989.1 hypothetical protein FJ976_20935 [Mesorhizobium sp. B1-1-9]TPN52266.1 hypothetical protein FJ978_12210 [Mesorhizobium sp. B1-1-7]
MIPLTNPPLVEVLRADTTSVQTAVRSLLEFYNPIDGGKFNYLRAVKAVRKAYKGFHQIDQLLAAPLSTKERVGYKPNQDVIALASPLAFNRRTQVFDLTGRRFPFARDRFATFRIPFFFTESGVVKLYFLQYRKSFFLSKDVYCGMFSVHRKFLLEQEFYGETCDVEYVDCSSDEDGGSRNRKVYSSQNLEMWSDERLTDQLGVVASAMDEIERRQLKVKRIRPLRDVELPLFD